MDSCLNDAHVYGCNNGLHVSLFMKCALITFWPIKMEQRQRLWYVLFCTALRHLIICVHLSVLFFFPKIFDHTKENGWFLMLNFLSANSVCHPSACRGVQIKFIICRRLLCNFWHHCGHGNKTIIQGKIVLTCFHVGAVSWQFCTSEIRICFLHYVRIGQVCIYW